MVRRVTPAEFQRLIREQQRKQREAINKYNRDVDRYNSELRRNRQKEIDAINAYNRQAEARNREISRHQQQVISNYNSSVRAHNARVQANRTATRNAISRLNTRSISVEYTPLRDSALALNDAYQRLEQSVSEQTSDANDDLVLGIPGNENTNSLQVVDALLAPEDDALAPQEGLQNTDVGDELQRISGDLDSRWRGALFALNPNNPDAARHFCTSAREVIIQILDLRAPDMQVIATKPDCARMRDGKPTRRAKIDHVLVKKGLASGELADFVEADINNVLDLFDVFNSATHGRAGKYGLGQLKQIKQRVEGGILFLAKLSSDI